ncbi:hypothetical protein [Nocardia sp. NPDC003183]
MNEVEGLHCARRGRSYRSGFRSLVATSDLLCTKILEVADCDSAILRIMPDGGQCLHKQRLGRIAMILEVGIKNHPVIGRLTLARALRTLFVPEE